MTAGWCVRVSVFDDLVVSISERELAGRDLSKADQELIRECAQHLLSFVGAAPLPASAQNRCTCGGILFGDGHAHTEHCTSFLPAAAARQEWQPIETAPKDGTVIIGALIRDGRVWRVSDMKHNGLAFYTVNGDSLPRMTHWLPLPDPQQAAALQGIAIPHPDQEP